MLSSPQPKRTSASHHEALDGCPRGSGVATCPGVSGKRQPDGGPRRGMVILKPPDPSRLIQIFLWCNSAPPGPRGTGTYRVSGPQSLSKSQKALYIPEKTWATGNPCPGQALVSLYHHKQQRREGQKVQLKPQTPDSHLGSAVGIGTPGFSGLGDKWGSTQRFAGYHDALQNWVGKKASTLRRSLSLERFKQRLDS